MFGDAFKEDSRGATESKTLATSSRSARSTDQALNDYRSELGRGFERKLDLEGAVSCTSKPLPPGAITL
eukprot:3485804-Alexandrium_andersonii.AAC.1